MQVIPLLHPCLQSTFPRAWCWTCSDPSLYHMRSLYVHVILHLNKIFYPNFIINLILFNLFGCHQILTQFCLIYTINSLNWLTTHPTCHLYNQFIMLYAISIYATFSGPQISHKSRIITVLTLQNETQTRCNPNLMMQNTLLGIINQEFAYIFHVLFLVNYVQTLQNEHW